MWSVLVTGVALSVILLLHAGGRDVSPILVFVMIAWVVAPFAALVLARRRLGNALIFVVAVGSPLIYVADSVRRMNAKAAFVYVVVPIGAWVLIAVALLIGQLRRVCSRAR